MSDYIRNKVLRVPVEKVDLSEFIDILKGRNRYDKDSFYCDLIDEFPDLFKWGDEYSFTIAPTKNKWFIDYILESNYGANSDSFGKTRTLYDNEKKKYLSKFQILDENINMDDVRLVEYCYYNGSEAPDYYDEKDPFYDEV